MRVLFVPSSTERAAAARYRVYQYRSYLERAGIDSTIFPAVSDFTTKLMLAAPTFRLGRRRIYYAWVVVDRVVRFLPILLMARHHDVVFLQRTTFFGFEKLLRRSCQNIVFDFDDAIFMSDPLDQERSWIGRLKGIVKAREVTSALGASRMAIVENQYLKRYAQAHGVPVAVIPGPVDTDHFVPKRNRPGAPITIGWIGSPATTPYLAELHPVLARLSRKYDICFKTIGAGDYNVPGVKTMSVPWSLESELSELQSFDIGIMPMPDTQWTRGKLGCKMLLYMAVGIPAVVSHTATNAEVIEDGRNGYLVDDEETWFLRLSQLIEDGALRKRLGEAARATIEAGFSVRGGAEKLLDVLGRVTES